MTTIPPLTRPVPASLFEPQYAVERELTGGGMCIVYLAEERKHQRQVVLKILRPEIAAAIGPERFQREIRIAATLTHPHILPLIDSGQADDLLYYVAPYIRDGSLRDLLVARKKLEPDEALHILDEIGSAVDYAHRSGFVHRDLKPENILFSEGHCLLADFGIARVLHGGEEHRTEVGLTVGTPAYMSPEQASGDRDLGPASDIYSLGCVLYETLTGVSPFHSGSARTTIMRHVTQQPPRVRSVRPEVPVVMEEAILRALAKDPHERFATAAEFVAACRARVRPHARDATRSIAVLPFANGSGEPETEYLSDGITEELINALAKVSSLRVSARSSVFPLKNTPHDARAVGALLGVSYVLDGMVRQAGRRLRVTAQLALTDSGNVIWSERFDRELSDLFDVQDEIARTIVSTLLATPLSDSSERAVEVRRTTSDAAYRHYLRGRYEWNKRNADAVAEAIRWFEQAIAEDPRYAPAYSGLADSYALHVDYKSVPVDEGFQRAKQYALRAIELDETLAEAHASLGWTLFIHEWDWDGAEREFRRAIDLDPRYATAHQWHSFLLLARGRVEEALVEAHTAVELDPASVSVRRSLGYVCFYARRYPEARAHLMRAVEMNPVAEETYRVIGLTWAAEGDYLEAERVFREAAALSGAGTYGQAMISYALARRGDRRGAERILRELERRSRTEYISPIAFATIALGLDDRDGLFRWLQRAREERRGWMTYLRVHPLLDPVRDDPRLDGLIRALGL